MHDEYQFGAARYSMRSTRYQHHTVSLKLDFSQEGDPAKRPQSAGTIGVSRRLSNAVITEYAQPEGAMNVYTVNIADGVGKDEEVTVTW